MEKLGAQLDKSGIIGTILLNLLKAFDCLPHALLQNLRRMDSIMSPLICRIATLLIAKGG